VQVTNSSSDYSSSDQIVDIESSEDSDKSGIIIMVGTCTLVLESTDTVNGNS